MSGILLSSDYYLMSKDMNKLNLAKNYPMSQHICPWCNKRFIREVSLRKHMETVMCMNRPYACQYCDQRFTFQNALTRHIYRGRCGALKKFWAMCNNLAPDGKTQTAQDMGELIMAQKQSTPGKQNIGELIVVPK